MLRSFMRSLFPQRCSGCRLPGSALCSACIAKIPFAVSLSPKTYAVYAYGNPLVRYAIRNLKYHHRSEQTKLLAHAAVAHITDYLSDTIQSHNVQNIVFVPIPEHRTKFRSRGFNQSLLLAQWWSDSFPESQVDSLLDKTVATIPQAHLKRAARMKNIAHTMRCLETLDRSRLYIVVDDVTTTGATFAEARRALSEQGATKIFFIALAHGYISH